MSVLFQLLVKHSINLILYSREYIQIEINSDDFYQSSKIRESIEFVIPAYDSSSASQHTEEKNNSNFKPFTATGEINLLHHLEDHFKSRPFAQVKHFLHLYIFPIHSLCIRFKMMDISVSVQSRLTACYGECKKVVTHQVCASLGNLHNVDQMARPLLMIKNERKIQFFP